MSRSVFDGHITDAMETLKGEFAKPVTYHPRTGGSYSINGIFDAAHAVIDNSGEVPHETLKPVLGIAWRDLRSANRAPPVRGDSVTIDGKRYSISEIMDDGHAEVRLVLSMGVTRA